MHASSSHGSDIFKIPREQEKNVCAALCAVHTVVPNIIMSALLIQLWRILQHHSCSDNAEHVQMPKNQRKYSNAKQTTIFIQHENLND